MLEDLKQIAAQAEQRIRAARDAAALEQARIEFLGRKGGLLTKALQGLGKLPADQRPAAGQLANQVRAQIESLLTNRADEIEAQERQARLAAEMLDVTLPGRCQRVGTRHPVTQVMDDLKRIAIGMGFEVVESPDVDTYYHNFQALNYATDHPAMDEQDSFYLTDTVLLRTQTSTSQIREMGRRQPPVRVVCIGRCHRRETVDIRRGHTFHQFEGFQVDRGITFADLKGTLAVFVRELFGPETQIQFRPDFFPFTEPSADYSVTCSLCKGEGCDLCKHSGWLEIGGCGMIHPNVLRNVGYDPEQMSGWAFGLGIDRLAQQRFQIGDMRLFYGSDLRFLRQFN